MVDLAKEEEQKLEEEIQKKIKTLPIEERVKAVSLNYFLKQKKNLDKELEKELETLNDKYDKLTLPLINQSGEIIKGRPLSEAELAAVLPHLSQEDRIKVPEVNNGSPIPDYWLKAFKNCPALIEDIQEKDNEVLKHLTKIDYAFDEVAKTNFTITFHFTPNNYFTNTELKKSFFFKEGEEIPEKTEGTEIQWKEGKNLTKKTVKKKQKNKKSGQQRVVTKEVDDESFFLFFNSSDLQGKKLEDLDDEEAEKIQGRLDIDFSIGQVLIEEVLPYSLEYYLGVKTMEGDDDGFEEEDIDEEDDEDDEDEEEESKPKGKKGGKKK